MSILSDKIRSAWTQLGKLFKPSLTFAQSVLIASAIVTVPLIAARQIGLLESAELSAYDLMLRLRPDESPDPRLLIVGITESDIQKIQQWPISDGKIAEILQKLETMQPRVIGLDVLRDVPQGEGRSKLSALLKKSDRIIGVCLVTDGSTDNPGSPPPPGMPENRVGFADFSVDPGGILRRALLFMEPPAIEVSPQEKHLCNNSSHVLTSFNLQLVIRYLQAENIQPSTAADQSFWLGSTQIKQLAKNEGGFKNADVGGYQILINYRSRRQPANQVRLTDVLEGKIDPNLVKDKVVLIGYTTDSVKDLFYTPYSAGKQKNQFMPGILAHAQVVSQLLSAVLDRRPLFWFWPEWAEILWISGWSMVGGTLAWRIAHPARLGLAFLGMLGVCSGVSFGLFLLGGWIPAVAPSLALIITGSSMVSADRFNKSGFGQQIKERVIQAFIFPDLDREKIKDEVEEITKSDAFQKARELREKKKNQQEDSSQITTNHSTEITNNFLEMHSATPNSPAELSQTAPHPNPEITIEKKEDFSQTTANQSTEITNNFPEIHSAVPNLTTELSQTEPHQVSEITNNSPEEQSTAQQPSENPPDDYFSQLQRKAKQQKQRDVARESANSQIDVPTTETTSEYEFSQLSQMQAKAKQMRERRNAEKKREDEKTDDLKQV